MITTLALCVLLLKLQITRLITCGLLYTNHQWLRKDRRTLPDRSLLIVFFIKKSTINKPLKYCTLLNIDKVLPMLCNNIYYTLTNNRRRFYAAARPHQFVFVKSHDSTPQD